MVKWADYCISHVRFNIDKPQLIELVVVREDDGDSFGAPYYCTRKELLDHLDLGYSYCTITQDEDASSIKGASDEVLEDISWIKGDIVKIVTINGNDYIKTVKDSIEKDNLGKIIILYADYEIRRWEWLASHISGLFSSKKP